MALGLRFKPPVGFQPAPSPLFAPYFRVLFSELPPASRIRATLRAIWLGSWSWTGSMPHHGQDEGQGQGQGRDQASLSTFSRAICSRSLTYFSRSLAFSCTGLSYRGVYTAAADVNMVEWRKLGGRFTPDCYTLYSRMQRYTKAGYTKARSAVCYDRFSPQLQ